MNGYLNVCKDSASDDVMEWLSVLVGVSVVIEYGGELEREITVTENK